MRYEDENIWLTQKMMAALYDVSVAAISQHIKRIYEDGELMPEATIKKYLTVQSEGSRQVSRNLDHYNLQMIIAVGFKVNNQRAVQFRKWAGQYFEIKLEHVDITQDEFEERMKNFKQNLNRMFAESHELEKKILEILSAFTFQKNI